jgi:hypothetical protein
VAGKTIVFLGSGLNKLETEFRSPTGVGVSIGATAALMDLNPYGQNDQ